MNGIIHQKLSMDALERKTLEDFKNSSKCPVIVILENIRSGYNVGSIFRTADAFLLQSIFICGYSPAPPHKEIKKTALGAEDAVHWQQFSNSAEAIDAAKILGFSVFAVEQTSESLLLQKASSYFNENKIDKIALVFGNEVSGVEQLTILQCQGCVEIPQYGTKHSLNIATAAGIVLWEMVQFFTKNHNSKAMPKIKSYLSLIKFSHTLFAMPFALIGFFLGIKHLQPNPDYSNAVAQFFKTKYIVFILVILCMVLARSAAMAFNRYIDRHFDAANPRTALREIPAGILKAEKVLLFTIICSLLFMACAYFINPLCFYLSPIAILVILGYSFTKRFTPFCHLILGLGLALAPIGAYLAVTGRFHYVPICFSLCVLFWVSGFDVIYALQDVAFDESKKLYSIPVWLGIAKALKFSVALHFISGFALIVAGMLSSFGWLYWLGALLFIALLIYQHLIVKPTDLSKVNLAFMTTNGFASILFSLFAIASFWQN